MLSWKLLNTESVTEQTRNDSFRMNWPTDDELRVSEHDLTMLNRCLSEKMLSLFGFFYWQVHPCAGSSP